MNLNRSILKTTRQSLTRALILVCRISPFNRTALMKRHKLSKMQMEDIRLSKNNSRISLGFRLKVSFRCSLNRKRICQSRKTMQQEVQWRTLIHKKTRIDSTNIVDKLMQEAVLMTIYKWQMKVSLRGNSTHRLAGMTTSHRWTIMYHLRKKAKN